jgi:hypothetical protein
MAGAFILVRLSEGGGGGKKLGVGSAQWCSQHAAIFLKDTYRSAGLGAAHKERPQLSEAGEGESRGQGPSP